MNIPDSAVTLEALLLAHRYQNIRIVTRAVLDFCATNPGWKELLAVENKQEFRTRVAELLRWVNERLRQEERLTQLNDGAFQWWVYLCGDCEFHRDLHGIALSPDHAFWKTHFPSNGWRCTCRARGARSISGIRRLGGEPDKPLPADWAAADTCAGSHIRVEPEFIGQLFPNFHTCLLSLARRAAPAR